MGLGSKVFEYLEKKYKNKAEVIKLEVSRVNTRAKAI